jgi:superoxide reductase
MAEKLEVYKCDICGNIVEVLHGGIGDLVCCGQPMDRLDASTEDEGKEKHVPVIEKTSKGVKVRIGSVPHPMEEEHHIEFIELMADGSVHRKFLGPGDKPEAEFCIETDNAVAREYCNVHGLWSTG